MDLIIGILFGALTIIALKIMGIDRERSFYPVLLIEIAFYYVLFGASSRLLRIK